MRSHHGVQNHPAAVVSRREVVERAEAYLRAHLDTPVPISTLCRLVGRSERGLRDAFYDVHGVGPKRWALAERLKGVRQALTRPGAPSTSVTLVATAHGFYQLGRFAGIYREAFGEAPSETLRGSARQSATNQCLEVLG
jgi:transcriptional regulator GlxA family with amidase domain